MKDFFNLRKLDNDFKKLDRDFEKTFGSGSKSHTFGNVKEPKSRKGKRKQEERKKVLTKQDIENAKKIKAEIEKTLASVRALIKKYRGEKMPNLNKMTDEELLKLSERIKEIECKREEVEEARKIIIAYYNAEKEKADMRKAERWNKVKKLFRRNKKEITFADAEDLV